MERLERLDAFLIRVIERGVPGLDLEICVKGEPVYRRWLGWRDRERKIPMNGQETYWLYSCSKVVTCVAALILYEQGEFLLNDPVSDYLPEFGRVLVRRTRWDGNSTYELARTPIQIRHLFTMTSGLDYDLHTLGIDAVIRQTDGRAPTREIVEAIARRSLLYEPGTHFTYGLSHDVLAGLVEVISGQRFSDFVRTNIFEPCGMSHSGYHLTDDLKATMARQYSFSEEQGRAVPDDSGNAYVLGSEYESGGAGMISSVEDYMRFANVLCNGGKLPGGGQLLSRGTIDLMRTNHLNDTQKRDFDWPHFDGYGYGLGVRTMVDRTQSGSTGPVGEFGWAGAAGAYVLIDPENQLTAYYAQHMLNSMEPYVHPRLRNLIYTCMNL